MMAPPAKVPKLIPLEPTLADNYENEDFYFVTPDPSEVKEQTDILAEAMKETFC